MSITYNEIMDTPNCLKRTAEYIDENWQTIVCFLNLKKRFVFLGSGSSFCLARSMSMMTYMHTGLPSVAISAGDLLLHTQAYAKALKDAAVICISRSGKTSEILKALDAITPYDTAGTAALVCADNTPLEERSQLSLNMPWAFDNSVCQTRCVTNFYFTAAYILGKMLGDDTLLGDLQDIKKGCGEFLRNNEQAARDAADSAFKQIVVLADAQLDGIAENAALAFKEVCQIPSNYYHLLDCRHGPFVLFDENTLLIAALGADDKPERDLISDAHKKGVHILTVSGMPVDAQGAVNVAYGRKLSQVALGLPLIMLSQMVSLFMADQTGANPDAPDGLDSWISL